MESWKRIKNYEDYSVSNYGRIRNDKTGRILKPGKNSCGYFLVVLCKNGIVKTHTIHRLVANAFIPNPENKFTVNHIDGCKTNNHADNLEWNTYSENIQHGYDTGLQKAIKGSKHVNSKLSENQVLEIRHLYTTGEYTYRELGKMFGVNYVHIGDIINRKKWKHI